MQQRHIFKRFDNELTALHGMVTAMARLVDEQIVRAQEVLRQADVSGAREQIARDAEINALDDRIDEELMKLIAKRQPVAGDLRELLTLNKIVTDLERCGDEIRKIGRLVIRLYDNDLSPPNVKLLSDVFTLAEQSGSMLRRVMHAFEDGNLDLALDVLNRDTDLEDTFETALRRLATYVIEDPRNVGHSIQVTLSLRALERIGGHAKNIAGYLVFLATGVDVRHRELVEVEELVDGLQ